MLLPLVACGPPPPDFSYETRRAHVASTLAFELCEGDLQKIDADIEAIESRLGMTRENKLEIYIFGAYEDLPCDRPVTGCYLTYADKIATTPSALPHELVHALSRGRPFPNDFWSEGTAEAVNGDANIFDPSTDALATYDRDAGSGLSYGAAGHFVRWTIQRRGADSFREFMRTGDPESAFGATRAELARDHAAFAPEYIPGWSSCDNPRIPQTASGHWRLASRFDCSTPTAESLEGWHGQAALVQTLVVPDGRYRLRVDGETSGFKILGCETEPVHRLPPTVFVPIEQRTLEMWNGDVLSEAQWSGTAFARLLAPHEHHVLDLVAGAYEVTVLADEASGHFDGELDVERLGDLNQGFRPPE